MFFMIKLFEWLNSPYFFKLKYILMLCKKIFFLHNTIYFVLHYLHYLFCFILSHFFAFYIISRLSMLLMIKLFEWLNSP